jgi:hypothetical protein
VWAVATVLSAVSCGVAPEPGEDQEVTGASEFRLIEADYPVKGEGDELVCAVYERVEDGQTFVEKEFYHVDRLRKQVETWPQLGALARDNGITDVGTCEGARAYSRLRQEFEESYDGVPEHLRDDEPEGLPVPLLEEPISDDPVDKIMEGVDVSPFGPGPLVWLRIWHGSGYSEVTGCSGMLLGPRHVLTAAHCFPHYRSGKFDPHV